MRRARKKPPRFSFLSAPSRARAGSIRWSSATTAVSFSPGAICFPRENGPKVGRSLANPVLLETNIPGVFAVGDVRHGSIKRVASGVGEGSVAIQFVHQYLSKI